MDGRFETFTVLIGKISRNIKRLKSCQMAQLDLKGPHVSCLYYLYRSGPLTAAELCDRCEEDKAAISRSLDCLEQNGYLVCRTEKTKKYKAPLVPTPKGAQAGQGVCERIERVLSLASQGLTEEERKIMYGALEKISGNLENLANQTNQVRR